MIQKFGEMQFFHEIGRIMSVIKRYMGKNKDYLKILQVSNSFYPCFDAGGVVRVVYDISKELLARGHEVTVYTTDGCTKRLNVEKNNAVDVDGIKVYYFRNLSNIISNKLKIATPYHLLRIVKRDVRNFDVIHIHEHRTFLGVLVYYYAKKYDVPYIVEAHGSLGPFPIADMSPAVGRGVAAVTHLNKLLKIVFDLFMVIRILKNAYN